MNITAEIFGEVNGQLVNLFRLTNDRGMEVACIDYGCTITEVHAPDKDGNIENVVLGFDTLDEYVTHSPFFGCVVGPVAGRIANAEYQLDDLAYQFEKNEGENHLHGGENGFDKVIWHAEMEESSDEVKVIFSHERADGTGGYPGNLNVTIIYTLNNDNELTISYHATTDKKTLINLTNHSYFNLSGNVKRDVLRHELTLKSDHFLELNDSLIPTGVLINVENTAFDFREGRELKAGVHSVHRQNQLVGNGYDHPLLLSANEQEEICLVDHLSGRKLVVETDQPCVVLYTANMMKSTFAIRGAAARKYLGVCLETQHHPDAIHHPEFPSIILNGGEKYETMTKYRFLVDKE